jgi:hypothetical protein
MQGGLIVVCLFYTIFGTAPSVAKRESRIEGFLRCIRHRLVRQEEHALSFIERAQQIVEDFCQELRFPPS